MKKLLISFILFLTFSVYSQILNISPCLSIYNELFNDIQFYKPDLTMINKDNIYILKKNNKTGVFHIDETINFPEIKNDSGFFYVINNNYDFPVRDYILEGKGIIVRMSGNDSPLKKFMSKEDMEQRFFFLKNHLLISRDKYYLEDGIKNILASSILKEGGLEYSVSNLTKRLFIWNHLDEYHGVFFETDILSWAEGVEGSGIGEYLICEFKFKTDEIQILNGYVNIKHPMLYLQNNRVKTILIESEEPKFSQEYTLEDVVKYNVLKLPARTDKIKITIKDVYKGTLYDDTCLSSIIADDPDYDMEADIAELKKWINDDSLFE